MEIANNNNNNNEVILRTAILRNSQSKIYLNQLENHYDKSGLLMDEQFGFRENHSTIHRLIIIEDYIEKEIQHDKQVVLISIDLRKAFDLIQTNGLLQKSITSYS